MPASIYEAAWIFVIYAFFGWCTEVAYAALELKVFVNRGFLNGPVCPIYGCGVLLVITVLTPLKEYFILLFAGSFLLTSAIEFLTGFLLEKIFHNQWWDYSEENFNLCGYVCLKFSILWGLGCTLILDVVHPAVYKLIKGLPKVPGTVLLILFLAAFLVDLCITVSMVLSFNKHLKLLNEAALRMKSVSDGIGENIYEGVVAATEKGEELRQNIGNKAEIDRVRLQKEFKRLLEHKNFGTNRLMKAFPTMKSRSYQEVLSRWKEYKKGKKDLQNLYKK